MLIFKLIAVNKLSNKGTSIGKTLPIILLDLILVFYFYTFCCIINILEHKYTFCMNWIIKIKTIKNILSICILNTCEN